MATETLLHRWNSISEMPGTTSPKWVAQWRANYPRRNLRHPHGWWGSAIPDVRAIVSFESGFVCGPIHDLFALRNDGQLIWKTRMPATDVEDMDSRKEIVE